MMAIESRSVLIVTESDPLRISLTDFIGTLPNIEGIWTADDIRSVLNMIVRCCPSLILLDGHVFGQQPSLVQMIQTLCSKSRLLVLSKDTQQQKAAQAAGVDVAVVMGLPAHKLFAIIKELLPADGTDGELRS